MRQRQKNNETSSYPLLTVETSHSRYWQKTKTACKKKEVGAYLKSKAPPLFKRAECAVSFPVVNGQEPCWKHLNKQGFLLFASPVFAAVLLHSSLDVDRKAQSVQKTKGEHFWMLTGWISITVQQHLLRVSTQTPSLCKMTNVQLLTLCVFKKEGGGGIAVLLSFSLQKLSKVSSVNFIPLLPAFANVGGCGKKTRNLCTCAWDKAGI